jgi:hydrogenase nickel incorporation protein HypB
MTEKIEVVTSVLKANDAVAAENRKRMEAAGVLALNITSAPGSGKTTLLEKSLPLLTDPTRCAVLVGDLQTTRDAERLSNAGVKAVQINTGRGCHLDATQVTQGLDSLDLEALDYVIIENVGNMVCPAGFDLGEHKRVVLLSTPEGEDKVAKYPTLFQPADVILLTKIDLAEILEFSSETAKSDLERINTHAPFLEISSKTGQGIDDWINWLKAARDEVFPA